MKTNIKTEAGRKCKANGVSRLQNAELRGPSISWVEFSAGLPSNEEFHVFWDFGTPLSRMSSAERSTDWNEPKMSDYLQQEILESSGGMWTAPNRPHVTCGPKNTVCICIVLIRKGYAWGTPCGALALAKLCSV